MRNLTKIEDFKREAAGAVFNKQQAISVTLKLLEAELADPENTDRDRETLAGAIRRINFNYLDATATETDAMLDAIGVARFSVEHIVTAIDNAVFDSEL